MPSNKTSPPSSSAHPPAMASTIFLSTAILSFLLLFISMPSIASGASYDPVRPKPALKPTIPKGLPANPFCPRDTLKLGVCAELLGGAVNVVLGTPPRSKCCTLLQGLADLDVAACLCTALKANVLGINLNVPLSLSAIVSACEKSVPTAFKCG